MNAACATAKSTVNGTSPATPLASSRDIGTVASCSLIEPVVGAAAAVARAEVDGVDRRGRCSVGVTVIEPFGLRISVACTSVRTRASSAGLGVAPTEQVVCVLPTPPARLPGAVPIVVKSSSRSPPSIAAVRSAAKAAGSAGSSDTGRARRGARGERLHLRGVEARRHVAREQRRDPQRRRVAAEVGPEAAAEVLHPRPAVEPRQPHGHDRRRHLRGDRRQERHPDLLADERRGAESGTGSRRSAGTRTGCRRSASSRPPRRPRRRCRRRRRARPGAAASASCSRAARSAASMRAIAPSPAAASARPACRSPRHLSQSPSAPMIPPHLQRSPARSGSGCGSSATRDSSRDTAALPSPRCIAVSAPARSVGGSAASWSHELQPGSWTTCASAGSSAARRTGARFLLQLESQGRHGSSDPTRVRPLCEPQPWFRRA